MTNAEIIQAIRVEIERLKGIGGIVPLDNREQKTGYESALIDVETFLDSLESKKLMNPEDAMKVLDEKIALVKQRGTWKGVDVDKYMDEVRGREPEKPMELEEEVKRYYSDNFAYLSSDQPTLSILTNVARHFAEWGYLRAAEKYNEIEYNRQRTEESVPTDLEEAAKKFVGYDMDCDELRDYEIGIASFIAGAKWDRQQMMKEAVEAKVIVRRGVRGLDECMAGSVNIALSEFSDGQRVRIIIVKED